MPTVRTSMKQITEILRLRYEVGLSYKGISRACGISKGVVSKYINLSKDKGITWPLPSDVDEAMLEAKLFSPKSPPSRFVQPDYFYVHQELKKSKCVTLQLLWEEYVDNYGARAYRYTQFCHYYKIWRGKQKYSMRQMHRAGEKIFIDYCGPTVPIIDRETGKTYNAQIFVAVLGASSYTFVEATRSQSIVDWISSNQRMLEFFGGVPELLIPDNLKSAVSKADRYNPKVNETYADFAEHYKTSVLPARPYKPKDKSKVEVAVQVVERWILAKLRHKRFFSLCELNRAISELLPELNQKRFQKGTESRQSLFEKLDKPALRALPKSPYVFAEWCKKRAGADYHIEVERGFYSVPHILSGNLLDVRITAKSIEVMHRGKCVAIHPRCGKDNSSTLVEHMPKSHQAHANWSPSRFFQWAREIGPCTLELVHLQLRYRPHPMHAYRSFLGLLQLTRIYGHERLEKACERASAINSWSYHC